MTKKLDPREETFCSCYVAIGEPTFSHKKASAEAAGFAEPSAANQATKLLQRPEIQQRIRELHTANMQRNMITVDKVLADLEHDKLTARAKGDIASAIRADELQGKYLALFTDRQEITEPARRELDEQEQAECVALAHLRLSQKYGLVTTPPAVAAGKVG
jgi:phage terminase small subunit